MQPFQRNRGRVRGAGVRSPTPVRRPSHRGPRTDPSHPGFHRPAFESDSQTLQPLHTTGATFDVSHAGPRQAIGRERARRLPSPTLTAAIPPETVKLNIVL